MSNVTSLTPSRALLGEGPVWVPREGRLYWVDLIGKRLHAHHLVSGENLSWSMPEMVGWIIPCTTTGDFIVGLQSGFARLKLDPYRLTPWINPHGDYPDNRLNDAKADRWGRIWAGSMHRLVKDTTGYLYRLHTDGKVESMDGPYHVTNGPAFNSDCSRMYHADSSHGAVFVFEIDCAGDIIDKSLFIRFPDEWGKPDGMTTDTEGGLWIAHWDGAQISRHFPDGKLDFSISVPVLRPTSLSFGGEMFDRLFVTSAARGDESNELAGAVLEVNSSLLQGHRGTQSCLFGHDC
jgi:xylono-1,5-lactonase